MLSRDFVSRYGPWALVTGGAVGMGEAFAELIATQGIHLVLTDIQGEELERTAARFRKTYEVEVRTVAADLSAPDFMVGIEEATKDLEIGLLISNAAVGHVGPFAETDVSRMVSAIDINVRATLLLTHHFCQDMIRRRQGGVVLLSSSSAYQGTPYVANYAATKAYILSLGEALWYELSKHGVDALAFAPGATNTPSLRSSKKGLKEGESGFGMQLPEVVARAALSSLGRAASARPGILATLETFLISKVLSRKMAVRIAGRIIQRGFS
jgi:short-subunit dehydrogenase